MPDRRRRPTTSNATRRRRSAPLRSRAELAHAAVVLEAGFGGLEGTTRLADEFGDEVHVELIEKSEAFEMIGQSALGEQARPANQQQAEAWNGPESAYFVDHADRYDRQLEPFTQALLERVGPDPDRVVLDVGCGSGATTLAAAATAERAVGVDLSAPLVELARRRARAAKIANAEFVIADAQTHDFAAGTFDVLISRFGLMFFDDPVRAFTNIRGSLHDGAHAAFVSWQGLRANEWLMVIANAVSRHADLPEFGGQARGPGMFALSEPDEITTLLGAAGFDQVECDSYTPTIVLGGGGGLDDSVDFLLGGGMPRGLLGLVDPSARDDVLRTVRAELVDRYEDGVGIRVGASVWVVTARA